MVAPAGESLWPGVFRWATVCLVGFAVILGGKVPHAAAIVPTLAGIISVSLAGVQLWPGDTPRRGLTPPRRRTRQARRCRARDPQRCRHPRCPQGHGIERGGFGQ